MLQSVCVVVAIVCGLTAETRGGLLALSFEDIRGIEWSKKYNSSIPELILDIYAPVSVTTEGSVECREHSGLYKDAARHDEGWAMKMLDASSLIPGSYLTGNRVQLGNYDECLSVEGVKTLTVPFSGQHCMVTTQNNKSRASRWAICIPSSCTPGDLETHLISALQGLIGNSTVTVGDNACKSRAQPSSLSTGDWLVIVFLGLIAVLVASSTVYDVIKQTSDSRSALFASFSVPANFKKLLATSTDSANVPVLDGIRTLSIMCVVFGHVDYYMKLMPSTNELSQGFVDFAVYQLATMSIDTFFIVSGLLVTLSFFRRKAAGKSSNLALFYLHRYIRLTPAFAMMMLLTATVFGDVGDGPLWQENVLKEQQHCTDNWWAGLIYVSNYVYPHEACLKQSWYLAANMQMFWLSPIVLYLISKWPKFWRVLIGTFIIVGIVISFPWEWLGVTHGQGSHFQLWYFVTTHPRVTPWVMGMGLGYMLHTTKATTANMSTCKATVGWVVSVLFFVGSFLNVVATEHLSGFLARPFWSISIVWIIYACHVGYGGFVNKILSWKVFQVLGRLSYSVYLVHFTIISMLLGSMKTPVHLSCTLYVIQCANILIMSFVAALVLYLVCEAPGVVIEQSLLVSDGCSRKGGSYTIDERGFQGTPDALNLSTVDMPFIDEDRKLANE